MYSWYPLLITEVLSYFWLTDGNHFICATEGFNFPQLAPQILLLPSGHQLLNMALLFLLHWPFVLTMYLGLLLHIQCYLLHFFSNYTEILVNLFFSFLLMVAFSTTRMAFIIHILLLHLHPTWLSTICCTPCNNIYRASHFVSLHLLSTRKSRSNTTWCIQNVLSSFSSCLQANFGSDTTSGASPLPS